MRRSAPKNWPSWRLQASGTESAEETPTINRGHWEQPGPDGIRWNLVRRIQAEIAAGTYDTEERFAAAEARLLEKYGS
jgi:hypothetical protein